MVIIWSLASVHNSGVQSYNCLSMPMLASGVWIATQLFIPDFKSSVGDFSQSSTQLLK